MHFFFLFLLLTPGDDGDSGAPERNILKVSLAAHQMTQKETGREAHIFSARLEQWHGDIYRGRTIPVLTDKTTDKTNSASVNGFVPNFAA